MLHPRPLLLHEPLGAMRSQTRLAVSTLLILSLSVFATGCVGKSKYEDALAQLAASQEETAETERLLEESRQQTADSEQQLSLTERELSRTSNEREDFRTALERARMMLDEQSDETEQLLRRLAELETIEAEERRRNELYRSFIERFSDQIEAGQLRVSIHRGRLVIELPQDILFASGSAVLGDAGSETIVEIANVLATIEDRVFQVEGHTDNVPIRTRQFPSNWELSSARALAVVHLLIEGGLDASRVSGAAFGEFNPRTDNESAESRELNRRIEIVMVPDLDLLSDNPIENN